MEAGIKNLEIRVGGIIVDPFEEYDMYIKSSKHLLKRFMEEYSIVNEIIATPYMKRDSERFILAENKMLNIERKIKSLADFLKSVGEDPNE